MCVAGFKLRRTFPNPVPTGRAAAGARRAERQGGRAAQTRTDMPALPEGSRRSPRSIPDPANVELVRRERAENRPIAWTNGVCSCGTEFSRIGRRRLVGPGRRRRWPRAAVCAARPGWHCTGPAFAWCPSSRQVTANNTDSRRKAPFQLRLRGQQQKARRCVSAPEQLRAHEGKFRWLPTAEAIS